VLTVTDDRVSAGGGSDLWEWNTRLAVRSVKIMALDTGTPTPPAPGTVLYQADWSSGRNGWSLPQGWDTVSGELVNDGTNGEPSELTALAHPPTITPYTADYAVEADIQVVRQTSWFCVYPGFGIAVRAESTGLYLVGMVSDSDGWLGFILDTSSKSSACSFNRLLQSALVKNSFNLDTDWHTYRVEVRGNDIKLLVDGNTVIETTDNHHLRSNAVGLWSAAVVLNVRSFKVIAL
jgi:hypothetical protein